MIEELFGVPFEKKRHDWIMGPKGRPLELDGYNKELKAAFEYNGIQHYQYHEFFHDGDPQEFVEEQAYDALKDRRCAEEGVALAWVPYWIPDDQRRQFCIDEYAEKGIKLPLARTAK